MILRHRYPEDNAKQEKCNKKESPSLKRICSPPRIEPKISDLGKKRSEIAALAGDFEPPTTGEVKKETHQAARHSRYGVAVNLDLTWRSRSKNLEKLD